VRPHVETLAPRHISRPRASWRVVVASVSVAAVAFLLYRSTLLPGLDFGDTASFQNAGGSIEATPRQSYPLYFALGNLMVWAAGGEPAFGMNLASAIAGAMACGLMACLVGMITGSSPAGLASGLLLAGSYTFWSQSVIAEVYALHVLLVLAALVALVGWSGTPQSLTRLGIFFAVYALGFGNHLMMILLAPAAILFIALTAGPRTLVSPKVIGLAALMAGLGALQYAWNFLYLWSLPAPPGSLADGLRIFWFDVTKADWRETLVLGVNESGLSRRWPMYLFDLRQQVGVAGVALAVAGTMWLAWRSWRLAAAIVAGYAVSLIFAMTYNVGDVHVFLLPSHVFVIVAAGCGAAALADGSRRLTTSRAGAVLAGLAVLALPLWRIADAYPALDRSGDRRAIEHLERLTSGLSAESLFIADLNWQAQNGLDYYVRHLRPDLNVLRTGNRMLTLPLLIEENRTHGREIVLTSGSVSALRAAYGDLFPAEAERLEASGTLVSRVQHLEHGTPYVLAVLKSYSRVPLATEEVQLACDHLAGGRATVPLDDVYMVIAGVVGRVPQLVRGSHRPFRAGVRLSGLDVEVRMESWLPLDTMRRAGFGHVIVDGGHALTLERGVSFVALDARGRPVLTTYAGGLYAPEPRYRIPPAGM
jgi:hypothetical protein